ncbi:MAG TPA: outer membrane lipoprotein carrier protein LolA [Burkholderiales bacterium]|nr:outer membrane lipoprotein carrier protein LolA [Burkholderiales bacterium]
MISGGSPGTRRRRAVLALLAAGFCSPRAIAAEASEPGAWDVNRLMRELGQVKSSRARFVESKHIAILSAPLESTGTLLYTAPGRLEKHTQTPRRESLVLEGDRLILENKDRNQRRTFALQDQPVIWAFVESIRSTLAGDLATLNRFYQVALDGGERQWRLTLKPAEPDMQGMVSEIRIGGSRNRVNTIEIIETQGDRSVMTITADVP